MDVKISSALALMFILMLNVAYAQSEGIIEILTDKTFEISVDNETKNAVYEYEFTFSLPPYRVATIFLEYTNEVNNSIIERSVINEASIFVNDHVLLTEKYDVGVQAFTLQKGLLLTPNVNHTGTLILLGMSEYKLMGTVNLHVEYEEVNNGFSINFNPLDFNANFWFLMVLVSSIGLIGTIIAVKKRRSSAEV